MMSPEALLWPWRRKDSSFLSQWRYGLIFVGVVTTIVLLTGCPNKTTVAQAPPPPPPPAPTATIEVSPNTTQPGQSVTVTWKTENASEVNIDPLGPVQANGSQTVTPTQSTTYRLTAKGPGGTQEASTRVTVASAATATNVTTAEEMDLGSANSGGLDVYFDTDQSSIRSDQNDRIKNDISFLKTHPDLRILIEGHCDALGSTEYNLALGEKRATEVKAALQNGGISVARMRTISYGKEKPFCEEDTEACWKQNRRAHITPDVQQ